MMESFKSSAPFYDLIYKEKDYRSEVLYVHRKIKSFHESCQTFVDFGCGTGNYSYLFSEFGLKVHGIDASQQMISFANRKRSNITSDPTFEHSSIEKFSSAFKWDVAACLFFVLGYQTTDLLLKKSFEVFFKNLKHNGILVFDFWYGPSVLKREFTTKQIFVDSKDYAITRKSITTPRHNENCLQIVQQYSINQKKDNHISTFTETHKVRYFFTEELEAFLEEAGFQLLLVEAAMTGDPIEQSSWGGMAFAKPKNITS